MDDQSKIIRKPSGVIQAIPMDDIPSKTNLPKPPKTLSLLQRKLWNLLLYNAYNELSNRDIDVFSIRVQDVCRALNINDIDLLKDCILGLGRTTIEFNYLKTRDKSSWKADDHVSQESQTNPDQSATDTSDLLSSRKKRKKSGWMWTWSTLLAGGDIEDGVMSYGFSDFLREKLQNSHYYTRLNMSIQARISSKYSLAIYELGCDHIIRETGKGFTPFLEIEELKKYLGCDEEKSYQGFREFNRTILKRSIDEINKKSDINIKITFRKTGKFISAAQFHVEFKKDKGKILCELFKPQQTSFTMPSDEIKNRLVNEYGLSIFQAEELINLFTTEVIEERLRYVSAQLSLGTVRVPAAFTYKAIKEGYKTSIEKVVIPQTTIPKIEPGMKIDIGSGEVFSVEEGNVIYIAPRKTLPEGTIRQGLAEGRYKIMASSPA